MTGGGDGSGALVGQREVDGVRERHLSRPRGSDVRHPARNLLRRVVAGRSSCADPTSDRRGRSKWPRSKTVAAGFGSRAGSGTRIWRHALSRSAAVLLVVVLVPPFDALGAHATSGSKQFSSPSWALSFPLARRSERRGERSGSVVAPGKLSEVP